MDDHENLSFLVDSWEENCAINIGKFSSFSNSLSREGVEIRQHHCFWSRTIPEIEVNNPHLNFTSFIYTGQPEKQQKATADRFLRATDHKQG